MPARPPSFQATRDGLLAYSFDPVGQRTTLSGSYARTGLPAATSTGSPPTYDAANRLATWNGTTLGYDNAGNLTSDGTSTYTWNARGQLTGITGGTSFAYDATVRRTSRTVSSATTGYLYSGLNPVQEQTSGGNANLLTGPGIDEYYTRTDGAGTRTHLRDTLGSTVALADNAGTVQTTYTYEPFGRTTNSGQSNNNPIQYTGRENDGNSLY